jgi:gamma-glutamyltranspeptidase / glutathione hydrolase
MKRIFLYFFFAIAWQACSQKWEPSFQPASSKIRIESQTKVVSATDQASQVGKEIMSKGGNAIDAAIAVQFALAVTFPEAGNLGGGGFMVIRLADGSTMTLDFRETAPAAASRNMYLDAKGEAISEKSLIGHLAAGVPGTVDGMVKAHQKFGKLKWEELLQPAIDLAEKGFPIPEREVIAFNANHDDWIRLNPDAKYLIKGNGWKEGDLLMQSDLASVLKRIRDKGRSGFYEGETAEMIIAEMKRGGGIITANDLIKYDAKWREPIIGEYKNYRVITMSPPSSGGICLLQLLKMAEHFPFKEWDRTSANTVHVMTELERLVFADRSEHLGDSDFFDVDIIGLLDSAYLLSRMKNITPDGVAANSEGITPGTLRAKESEETTHFSIVDAEGNAVSVTTTLNSAYGSMIFVKGCGFLLNNEMDDFSVKPGVPNQYGLVGNEANAIQPEKRMLSAMTPTIIEKNGKLFMVLGSPGGPTIITSVFQVFLNVVEWDMTLNEAVNHPRIHHQWLPDVVYYELGAISQETRLELTQRNYSMSERPPIGSVEAILVNEDGSLTAVADWRRNSVAR